MKRVIIHKGQAHADDFLAIAFALALGIISRSTSVFRRDPTTEELGNPNVLVLDVGEQHLPALNNFDHHQRGKDEDPECAMSLFLAHYAPEARKVLATATKWFNTTVALDVNGPFALAKEAGCSPDLIFGLAGGVHTPIVKLLEKFQGDELISDEVMGILEAVGKSHLEYVEKLIAVRKDVDEHAHLVEVDGVEGLVYVQDQRSSALGAVLADYREEVGSKDSPIAFAVLKDDRGSGITLYRFADDPRIDFTKLVGREEVAFVHPGGFIAKTKYFDPDGALDLVKLSVV